MGSFSKILKYNTDSQDWITFEAFHDEKFKIGKLLHKETELDRALESLLEIIQQMAISISTGPRRTSTHEEIPLNVVTSHQTRKSLTDNENENRDLVNSANEIELPYIMHKDKINGISVKLFGADPNLEWTTAMKFLLTNVKWLLAYSSSQLISSSRI